MGHAEFHLGCFFWFCGIRFTSQKKIGRFVPDFVFDKVMAA